MSNTQKLQACFRDVLGLAPDVDVTPLAYQQHPSWDSVAHMRLIAAIETAFDIMLETDQILDMSSYAKAVEIVTTHGIDLAS